MSFPRLNSAASSPLGDAPHDGFVLLVEQDDSLGSSLGEQLCADRLYTVIAHTSEHARVLARSHRVRAMILGELESPRGALDLLEEVRRGALDSSGWPTWDACLPAIVLGPTGSRLDLLRAFEVGADDFISRPPSYLELRARLKALLRRAEGLPATRILRVGLLEVDTGAHAVRFGAESVDLCRLEYELLVHLARNPTVVCPKQELLLAIWKRRTSVGARTVDSHASRLRRKLDAAGADGMVVNVWGVGYRLL
jgi:DNA-binding response OmpR family regulator